MEPFVIGLAIVFFHNLQMSLNANRAHIAFIILVAMLASFVTIHLIVQRESEFIFPYILGSGLGAGLSYLFRKKEGKNNG